MWRNRRYHGFVTGGGGAVCLRSFVSSELIINPVAFLLVRERDFSVSVGTGLFVLDVSVMSSGLTNIYVV